jgi:NADH-quinone oxidoreductase subunit C
LVAAAAAFPEVEFESVLGDTVARASRDDVVGLLEAARGAGFELFIDLCAVDYLSRNPRFDIAINVVSVSQSLRLRVLVGIPGTDPQMPTVSSIYPGSNFYEREAFDLFGIEFSGHPDMTRILLPDDWEGHPLRKDVSVGSVPVQFKGANKAR